MLAAGLLVLLALAFYAFLAFGPNDLKELFLVLLWAGMGIAAIYSLGLALVKFFT